MAGSAFHCRCWTPSNCFNLDSGQWKRFRHSNRVKTSSCPTAGHYKIINSANHNTPRAFTGGNFSFEEEILGAFKDRYNWTLVPMSRKWRRGYGFIQRRRVPFNYIFGLAVVENVSTQGLTYADIYWLRYARRPCDFFDFRVMERPTHKVRLNA